VTDDLMAQFAQMQKYTTALHNVINTAQDQAPQQSEGSDQTGTVHVTLGPDGLPVTFRVGNNWKHQITPETFGGAVFNAFQAAIGDRLTAWGDALADNGWQQRVDELKGGPAHAPDVGRIPLAFRKPVEDVAPRAIDEVTEDVLRAFGNVDSFAAQSAGATGADRTDHLTIGLSATGMTSCTVDARWVADQSAAALMNALSEALLSAKEDLASKSEQRAQASGLDDLVTEAMALLKNVSKYTD
jgi:hypothetical protein